MVNFKILENVVLAPYTTFKIGGPARYFCEPKTIKEVIRAIKWAQEKKIKYFILGGGSNILVADKGFDGLVIKLQITNYKLQNDKIFIGAGVNLTKLIQIALENSLSGLEWAVGIPGTVGGAIRGNAGAMGHSMNEVVKNVEVLISGQKIVHWSNQQCQFGYRDSVFKSQKFPNEARLDFPGFCSSVTNVVDTVSEQNPKLVILSAEIQLEKGNKKEIQKRMAEYLAKRGNQPREPSAGCVFKNIVFKSIEIANEFCKKYPEAEKVIKDGKLPAGWLIEQCNLKGKRIGQAKISEKHANFIVNLDGAKAEDVLILISLIKQKVRSQFNIQLQEEIEVVI